MFKPQVTFQKAGAYLFKAPATIRLELNRNFLLVFCAPQHQICSFVLTEESTSPKKFTEMLDNAFNKLLKRTQHQIADVYPKLFGLSSGNPALLHEAIKWLNKHGLDPNCKDCGKFVSRSIIIDCNTCKVGVSYASGDPRTRAEILTQSSARNRLSLSFDEVEILILSASTVGSTLAKQAVEEYQHWKAFIPEKPEKWIKKLSFKKNSWPLVFIFDDWDMEASLVESWIKKTHKQNPSTLIFWVGNNPPPFSQPVQGLVHLPPPEPEFLGEFKTLLAQILLVSKEPQRSQQYPYL